MKRKMTAVLAACGLLMTGLLSGCGSQEAPAEPPRDVIAGTGSAEADAGADTQVSVDTQAGTDAQAAADTAASDTTIPGSAEESSSGIPGMTMQFGYEGPVYNVVLEDNDTAATLADYAARGEYNLPIYTYENYENEDILQFYDIPSRYVIPDDAQHYTEEKAGELYYSYPNRVILFYQDAQIEADYTKIGTLTSTDGLVDAVRNNVPLEYWDCLVIPVRVTE